MELKRVSSIVLIIEISNEKISLMAMHACQIGPTDTAPPCQGSPHQACVATMGERFEAGNLSAPISPLLLKCADGATTLSLYLGSWS